MAKRRRKTYRDKCGCTHDGAVWALCDLHKAECAEVHRRWQGDHDRSMAARAAPPTAQKPQEENPQ